MVDICVWNKCNNNCIMCTNPIDFQNSHDTKDYTYEKITERVKGFKEYLKITKENINLTGGEPTIHPDFLKLLKWFRSNFPQNRIAIATNARRFYYPLFAKEALKTNNVIWEVSFHGWDKKSCDDIAFTPNSFEQTVKGISNILKYRNDSHEIELRVVIIKQNYQSLDKNLNFIYKHFSKVDRVVLIFQEIEGMCEKNFKSVGVTYGEVRNILEKEIKKWVRKFKELRLYHFPLCTLNYSLWKYVWRTLPQDEVSFLPTCKKCLYKKHCLGIHKEYLKMIGGNEFRPIKKKVNIKSDEKNYFHPILDVSEIDQR